MDKKLSQSESAEDLGLLRQLRLKARSAVFGGPVPFSWWELAGYGGLMVVGAAMRLWDLGARAMHHDESLHALYAYNLANGDGYQHNPMMHGPLQFKSNAAIFFILGDSDYTARLSVALMGTLLIALPILFRGRLGRPGGLIVAAGLTISPAMLYFSRFARNDIFMAVWSLGLVISMWRYLDEGRSRYLYASAALLALAFTTKETSYMLTSVLALYLILVIIARRWPSMRPATEIEGLSLPDAIKVTAKGIRSGLKRPMFEGAERHGAFLTLLVTLTMVQWSAIISYFQDSSLLGWTNLVLAQPVGSPQIGSPEGGGLVVAFLFVIALLGLSIRWGAKWDWSLWWRCAVIFWVLWTLLYSTFFTNIDGIGSGVWQSLGYWIVQQSVARGNQPSYYYVLITSVYEFLPLIFGLLAAVYYVHRRDPFGVFLVYWALTTFILYTIASEKMPWLLVNIALPFIVITGRFLGEAIERIAWRRVISHGGILTLPGVPLFVMLLWQLVYYDPGPGETRDIASGVLLALATLVVVGLGTYLARTIGTGSFLGTVALSLALMLAVLSIRSGVIATYKNGDTPVELLVYTHTSPDVVDLVNRIEAAGASSGLGNTVPIIVDQTSGFTWPWAWYLRGRPSVDFPLYDNNPLKAAPDSSIVLVHLNNKASTDNALKDTHTKGERFPHRWWFPENAYRDLTVGKFLSSFADRDAWRRAMDYFLHRKGMRNRLGSEDAVAYFANDLLTSEIPR